MRYWKVLAGGKEATAANSAAVGVSPVQMWGYTVSVSMSKRILTASSMPDSVYFSGSALPRDSGAAGTAYVVQRPTHRRTTWNWKMRRAACDARQHSNETHTLEQDIEQHGTACRKCHKTHDAPQVVKHHTHTCDPTTAGPQEMHPTRSQIKMQHTTRNTQQAESVHGACNKLRVPMPPPAPCATRGMQHPT